MKAWCGAEDEPAAKKVKREASSEDDDYSDGEGKGNDHTCNKTLKTFQLFKLHKVQKKYTYMDVADISFP